jgi:DDE family transposase
MGWSETTALGERFGGIRGFLKRACPHWQLGTSYSGWIAAQLREQQRLVPMVIERFRAEMRRLADLQCGGRWNAFAVDGSDSPCPRTLANQAAMGDKGKPDGIPQVAMTKLLHLRTGLPWSFRVGPGTVSERAQLREMLDDLPSGSLLVADAGFVGYELCRDLLERGQHFLWRVGGNVHLLTELGNACEVKGTTVYLWPQDFRDQPPLKLRLIEFRDENKQTVCLVTSVLDPAELTDDEAGEIFAARWGIEVNYRTLKQTLEFPALRSQTPDTCYLELTWMILSEWLLKLLNVRALARAGVDPRCASPAQTRNAVRRCLHNEPPCRRTRRSLARALTTCQLDRYQRASSKASRDYPRKKKQRPPGPPILQPPTKQQLQAAKQLIPLTIQLK